MADDGLARELAQFREDMHTDLADLKAELGRLLPREVYDLKHQQLLDRNQQLSARIDAVEQARRDDAKQRRADRRWLIGAVVIPMVVLVVQIIVSLRGPA